MVEEMGERCIRVNGVHLSIMTWAEVIANLHTVATYSAIEFQSDIDQLDGYCAQMDSDAFIPFRVEDLTAETAKKIGRYYDVIDRTVNLLLADEENDVKSMGNVRVTKDYYERVLNVNDFEVSLIYDRNLWEGAHSVDTPFGVAIGDWEWQKSEFFQRRKAGIPSNKQDDMTWSFCYFALEPLQNATLDEGCLDLKRQVFEYVNLFQEV